MVVALGGDGLMLQVLHRFMDAPKPIYGMNRGTVGFLMNEFGEDDLRERLEKAHRSVIHPLLMEATDTEGRAHKARAINEVYLLRQTHQTAKLKISVDGQVRSNSSSPTECSAPPPPAPRPTTSPSEDDPAARRQATGADPDLGFRPRRWAARCCRTTPASTSRCWMPATGRWRGGRPHGVRRVRTVETSLDRTTDLVLLHDPGHSLTSGFSGSSSGRCRCRHCERREAIQGGGTPAGAALPWIASLRSQ